MLLAYADESGDNGPIDKGASLTYTVGCVLVEDTAWSSAFNEMIDFRRRLAAAYRLPVRSEVKATLLIGGGGHLRKLGLSPAERGLIFRAHLRQLAILQVRAFAVVVDKRATPEGTQVDRLAWTTLFERLERTSTYEHKPFTLIHDNGDNLMIRKVARMSRRRITAGSAFGGGQLVLAAKEFIDDPVPRDSAQSYFIQLADLVAYSAFRTVVPPGRSVAQVAPATLWDEIGDAVHGAVNRLRTQRYGDKPGIVLRNER